MNEDTAGIRGQRVRRSKGHESIRREALQDPVLSFKATGMLAYLLSLPDNWRTDADRLSKAKNAKGKAREGRDAMQTGLRELEEAGYLLRRKYQDERGTWRWIWRYSDDPADLQQDDVSAGQTGNGLPDYGSPVDDPAVSGSPGDLEVLDVEVLEKRDSNLSPSTPDGAATDNVDHDLFGASTPTPAKDEKTARDVVQAWFDGYAKTGVKPPGHRGAQVGAEAKRLLKAGNNIAELIKAAGAAGELGWWSIERQLTAAARRNGGGVGGDRRSNGHVAYQNLPASAYVRTKPRHYTSSDQQGDLR